MCCATLRRCGPWLKIEVKEMDKIYLFKIMVDEKVSYVEIDAPDVRVARLIFRDYKRHYLQEKDFCLLAVYRQL